MVKIDRLGIGTQVGTGDKTGREITWHICCRPDQAQSEAYWLSHLSLKKNSAHINRSIEILICLMSNKHDRKLPTGLNFDRDLSCHFNNYLTKGLIKRFYDCCKLVIHKLTESTKRVFKDITSCIIRPYKYLSTWVLPAAYVNSSRAAVQSNHYSYNKTCGNKIALYKSTQQHYFDT